MIFEGKFDIRREEKIKFEDFADEYLELHSKINNKAWRTDQVNLAVLKRFFSGRNLHEITPHLIERFKSDRTKEGVSPATVNRQLATLKCLFNRAIAWKKFSEANPVCAVRLFKENNQRKRFLEKDEITKLLAQCHGHLKPMVIVALNTGMRRGEILGLKWRDLDINKSAIYLRNTKNGEPREVPINEQVKTALIAVPKHPDSEYIFHKKDGSPVKDTKTTWLKAIKRTGINDFRFHDLRHTAASHLVMSGIDMLTVASILGHKDLKMTQRYAHLSTNHRQRAVEILGERLNPPVPQNTLPAIQSQTVDFISA
jgi:integrase